MPGSLYPVPVSSHSTLLTSPTVADACTSATILGWQIRLHSRDLPSPMNGCFSSTPSCSACTPFPSRPPPTSLSSLESKGTDSGCPSRSLFHPEPVLLLPYVRMGLSTLHPDGLFLSFSFSSCPQTTPVSPGSTPGSPRPDPGIGWDRVETGARPRTLCLRPNRLDGETRGVVETHWGRSQGRTSNGWIQTTSSTRDPP